MIEGNRIAELKNVYQLVRDHNAAKVRHNAETRVEESEVGGVGTESLTRAVVTQFQASGMANRTTLQFLDWSSLHPHQRTRTRAPAGGAHQR